MLSKTIYEASQDKSLTLTDVSNILKELRLQIKPLKSRLEAITTELNYYAGIQDALIKEHNAKKNFDETDPSREAWDD